VKTIPKGIRVVKWLNALSLELYIKDVASKGTGTESSGIPKDDDPGDVSDGSGREPKMVRIK
jgi:hypothetical protein